MNTILTFPTATLGDRIRAARKSRDLTQFDLSRRMGISRAAVGQWEIDATSPSVKTLSRLGELLRVTPEWLAFGRTPPVPEEIQGNIPHRALLRCPEEQPAP